MSNDEETSEEKGVPWTLVAAGLIVALIVAMGVVLSVRGLAGDDTSAAPASPSTSTSSPTEEGSDSVCGLPGHETSGTVNRAPKAEWRLVGSIAAPKVEGAGPGVIDDEGFGYCYAHTPEGAVLAAANLFAQTATNEVQAKTFDKLLVPGPGRDAAMAALEGGSAEEVPPGARMQIAGFRLSRYTEAEAHVDIAVKFEGRTFTAPFSLQWVDGDWKLVVADDGSMVGGTEEVPDLSGYIAWSGA